MKRMVGVVFKCLPDIALHRTLSNFYVQKCYISKSVPHFRRGREFLRLERCLDDPPPPLLENEYTDTPEYPEIFDPTRKGIKKLNRLKLYSEVKALPTVLEKLIALSKFRVKAYILKPFNPHMIESPTFQEYCTRTQLFHGLPEKYSSMNVDQIYDKIKPYLVDALKMENGLICRKNSSEKSPNSINEEIIRSKGLMFQLLSILFRSLSADREHLIKSCCDYFPRCESYWSHVVLSSKSKTPDELEQVKFQFIGSPNFQIRLEQPLEPFVPRDDPLCKFTEIPEYNYHPRVLKLRYEKRFLTSVPGFWPGDTCVHSLMSLHSRLKMKTAFKFELKPELIQDLVNGFGIMASFGWLNGLATYHGFTQYHDLTYPLVTQTILTDGQVWTFFAYQLNTISFHKDVDTHSVKNLCWTSGDMKLYETYEDGEFKNFNDDVLKILIKFFINSVEIPSGVQLKPYVQDDFPPLNRRRRYFLNLKKVYSNKPCFDKNEIPLWKRIYKFNRLARPSPWLK